MTLYLIKYNVSIFNNLDAQMILNNKETFHVIESAGLNEKDLKRLKVKLT